MMRNLFKVLWKEFKTLVAIVGLFSVLTLAVWGTAYVTAKHCRIQAEKEKRILAKVFYEYRLKNPPKQK